MYLTFLQDNVDITQMSKMKTPLDRLPEKTEGEHYTVGDALVLFVALLFSEAGIWMVLMIGLICLSIFGGK